MILFTRNLNGSTHQPYVRVQEASHKLSLRNEVGAQIGSGNTTQCRLSMVLWSWIEQ